MSDHEMDLDTRPRRRRESVSPSESNRREKGRHRERSRDRRERGRERERSRERSRDRESGRGKEKAKEKERRRRHRSRSPGRESHRHRRRRDSRSRSRSRSPRRNEDEEGDQDPDRSRRSHKSSRRNHRRSRSRSRAHSKSTSPIPHARSRKALPSQSEAFTGPDNAVAKPNGTDPADKEKPNFGNTGRLAAESNKVTTSAGKSIVLKYHEPAESRKPPAREEWRLYIFKEKDLLDTITLNERTCWLFGREAFVADILVEHPSCSGQHAVLQFRYIEGSRGEDGVRKKGKVRPYLIDLESANGTSVNGEKCLTSRFVELRDGDVVRFGNSTREYVLMKAPGEQG